MSSVILPEFVTDTHALFWYLLNSPQLGPNARAAFMAGEQGQATIVVPSIVLAELFYANAKQGRPLDFARAFAQLRNGSQFVFVDFRPEDTLQFDALTAIPEMHDRMIASVAITRNCPLLTRDGSIVKSGLVKIVW